MQYTGPNVLVVEDNPSAAELLGAALESRFQVVYVGTGSAAVHLVHNKFFAAILLSLVLPDMPGQAVIAELRRRGSKVPIIVVSTDVESEAAAGALRAGADVVLPSPVSVGVLQAQLQALLRRNHGTPEHVAVPDELALAGVTFNRRRCSITRNQQEITLRPREYQLVLFLAERKGKVLSREELIRLLQTTVGRGQRPHIQTITVHMKRVRDGALEVFGVPLVHTSRGEGYYFDAQLPVQASQQSPHSPSASSAII